jgi:hypothetical protein
MSTFYIKYHIDKGEGDVKFPATWKECDIVWQLDWITALQEEYDRLQEEDAKKYGKEKSQLILGRLGYERD